MGVIVKFEEVVVICLKPLKARVGANRLAMNEGVV